MRRNVGICSPVTRPREHTADGSGVGKDDEGSMVPEEHPAAGALGSASNDLPKKRFPDVARKRETVLTATLAADEDLAEAPIDIVEFEPDDLTAA